MSGNIETALTECRQAGRNAFREHGVTGASRHSFPLGGLQHGAFASGHTEERYRAHDRALDEALAYHTLSVRDTGKDRAWAERLSSA